MAQQVFRDGGKVSTFGLSTYESCTFELLKTPRTELVTDP